MSKINWIPVGVSLEEVKADLGFTGKEVTLARQPVLEAKAFDGDNGGFTRLTTSEVVFMASVAALKAAGMPKDCEEGSVDVSCRKGRLKIHLNK